MMFKIFLIIFFGACDVCALLFGLPTIIYCIKNREWLLMFSLLLAFIVLAALTYIPFATMAWG